MLYRIIKIYKYAIISLKNNLIFKSNPVNKIVAIFKKYAMIVFSNALK
jgi:hypothetical protein